MWTPPKKRPVYTDLVRPVYEVFKKERVTQDINDIVVGIEIENETKSGETIFPNIRGWNRVAEHSLRYNGVEYVSKPLRLDKVKGSLESLFENIQHIPFTNSIRTSTHVHLDVGHFNFLQIINYASLYWMLEPCFETFVGAHRSGNHFCLRLKDTSVSVYYLTESIRTGAGYNNGVFYDNLRYASLNLASVPKFGTMEFRLMRGVSNPKPIMTWIAILKDIRDYSLRFKTPKELNNFFLDGVDLSILPRVVLSQETLDSLNTQGYPLNPVDKGVYLVIQDLLVSHDTFDWTREITIEEEKLRKKKEEEERIRQLTMYNSIVAGETGEPPDLPTLEEGNDEEYVTLEENF